jgi:small subunit ribosomal protein S18
MNMTEDKQKRHSILDLTYLDAAELNRYVTETGRILNRRINRFTSKQQRHLTRIIKRARNMLLMK